MGRAATDSKELDWRALPLAVVAGLSTFSPSLTLAGGAVLGIGILLTKVGMFRLTATDLWATGLAVFAAMSLNWAVSPTITRDSALTQFKLLIIFVSIRVVIVNRRSLMMIAVGYWVGCLYAVVLLSRQNRDIGFAARLADQRYGIEGVNINYLAYALATGVAVIVLLWYSSGRRRFWRLTLLLTAAPIYFGIALSGTRGALLAVGLLVVWAVVHRYTRRVGLLVLYAVVVAFSAAIVSGAVDNLLSLLAKLSSREDTGLGGRLYIWPVARRVFSEHLLTGVGASGFQSINPIAVGSHNVFLEIGTGMGLVGICLFIGLFFSAIVSSSRGLDTQRRTVLVGSYLTTVAPIYLSGQWDLSAAGWVSLALFSRLGVLSESSAVRTCLPVRTDILGPSATNRLVH